MTRDDDVRNGSGRDSERDAEQRLRDELRRRADQAPRGAWLPDQILAAVRGVVGDAAAVGLRLSADEMLPGGLGPDEMVEVVAALLERTPVDFLHVSHSAYVGAASLDTQMADMTYPTGAFRAYPARFKQAFPEVPVLAICRIDDIATAAQIVGSGEADMAGMARGHIADPRIMAKAERSIPSGLRPAARQAVRIRSTMSRRAATIRTRWRGPCSVSTMPSGWKSSTALSSGIGIWSWAEKRTAASSSLRSSMGGSSRTRTRRARSSRPPHASARRRHASPPRARTSRRSHSRSSVNVRWSRAAPSARPTSTTWWRARWP